MGKIIAAFSTNDNKAKMPNMLDIIQTKIKNSPIFDFNLVVRIVESALFDESEHTIYKASSDGNIFVVKYLVENGAAIHANNNYALRRASKNGHLSVMRYLVENGADIHACNDCALRWASERGHLSVVQYLVENGADILSIQKFERK